MSLPIKPDTEAKIMALAAASGVSVDELLAALVAKESAAAAPNAFREPAAKKPLSARIREIWKDIPADVRAKLPADGASEHDHYIYGAPKRTP